MPEEKTSKFLLPEGVADLLIQRCRDVEIGTVIVLPVRLGSPGGLYRDQDLTSVKELRAASVPAEFLHPPNQRTGLSEFSADIGVAFAVGIAQNMTWDAAKALWQYLRTRAAPSAHRGEDALIRLEVARVRRPGLQIEGLSLTAPANDSSAEQVLRLLVGDTDPEGTDKPGDGVTE
jgi:hypothetical protein